MAIHPAKRRRSLLLVVIGILLLRVALNITEVRGAWATNRSFLGLNHFRAGLEAGIFDPVSEQRSIDSLERATVLNPDNDSTWRALGYLLLEQGDEDGALAAWRNSAGMAAELFEHGVQAEKADDDDQALAWFQRTVAVAPDRVEAWLKIGAIDQQREDSGGAATAFRTGLETTPNSSDLIYRLGQTHVYMGESSNWGLVRAYAERAIAEDNFLLTQNQYQAHFLLGEALRNLGREKDALAEYTIASDNLPRHYWSMFRRAELAWQVNKDAATAKRYYLAAIDIDPNTKWAYRQLGLDLVNMGHPEEARRYFEKVLSIDPEDHIAAQWLRDNP